MTDQPEARQALVYVGNWDPVKDAAKPSFHVYRYNPSHRGLVPLTSAAPGIRVGATHMDERRNVLFCTDEDAVHGDGDEPGGRVLAFAIDNASGALRELSWQPSYGANPSYCVVDSSGEYLLVTHHTSRQRVTRTMTDSMGGQRLTFSYDDASLVLFPLGDDGSIGPPCDVHVVTGNGGPLPQQTHPQLHSVTMSPSGGVFVVCDKGCDRIMSFGIDRATRSLRLLRSHATMPGGCPRYSVFHPTLPYLFVNYEMKAAVEAFRLEEDGTLTPTGVAASLLGGMDEPTAKQSDLAINGAGDRLYCLLRGPSAVSVFAFDEASGQIELIQTVAVDGAGPRGCALSPDGDVLLIAAYGSDEVLIWSVASDGTLSPTGERSKVPCGSGPGTVTVVGTGPAAR